MIASNIYSGLALLPEEVIPHPARFMAYVIPISAPWPRGPEPQPVGVIALSVRFKQAGENKQKVSKEISSHVVGQPGLHTGVCNCDAVVYSGVFL